MGNLEKLFVLTVIFLSGVVLAVSLNSTKTVQADGDTPSDSIANRFGEQMPLVPAQSGTELDLADLGGSARPASGRGTDRAAKGSSSGSGSAPPLLSADVEPKAESSGRGIDSGGIDSSGLPKGRLRQVDALAETVITGFALYTCDGSETFSSLARDLYGSVEYANVIRANNEGLEVLTSGDELLVPIDARPSPTRDHSYEARPSRPAPRIRNVSTPEPIAADEELGTTEVLHTVVNGESLSTIAAAYYGKGTLWRRIYDHNRDVLDSPDRVPEGTVLKIP
ncbi:LysM peptidoglycan-binding domain-containing protein [Engelhardtia mirabilis]|uniref:LysM domain/BON superfamily protein n=1 Tax=Engelhardtia mirabilis TaxID=2528011 RepID=A0A518BNP1_9BACT|nr:LysM domain/BON superfamily protein [Planctomycetes bacterium Pla133]QDV02925.1 LysM domain/BON superfamily protein [Planctomycetes bacterium Pla86]